MMVSPPENGRGHRGSTAHHEGMKDFCSETIVSRNDPKELPNACFLLQAEICRDSVCNKSMERV